MQARVEQTLTAQSAPLTRGCLRLLTVRAHSTVLRLLVHLAGLSVELNSALLRGLLGWDSVRRFDPLLLLVSSISSEASMELLKLLCSPESKAGVQRWVVGHGGVVCEELAVDGCTHSYIVF